MPGFSCQRWNLALRVGSHGSHGSHGNGITTFRQAHLLRIVKRCKEHVNVMKRRCKIMIDVHCITDEYEILCQKKLFNYYSRIFRDFPGNSVFFSHWFIHQGKVTAPDRVGVWIARVPPLRTSEVYHHFKLFQIISWFSPLNYWLKWGRNPVSGWSLASHCESWWMLHPHDIPVDAHGPVVGTEKTLKKWTHIWYVSSRIARHWWSQVSMVVTVNHSNQLYTYIRYMCIYYIYIYLMCM